MEEKLPDHHWRWPLTPQGAIKQCGQVVGCQIGSLRKEEAQEKKGLKYNGKLELDGGSQSRFLPEVVSVNQKILPKNRQAE